MKLRYPESKPTSGSSGYCRSGDPLGAEDEAVNMAEETMELSKSIRLVALGIWFP